MKKEREHIEIGISERTLYRKIKRETVKGLKRSDWSYYDSYVADSRFFTKKI